MSKNRSLFPAQPRDQMIKTAGSRLSTNAKLWKSEIITQMCAEHPYLDVDDMELQFNKMDPIKGAALGSVKISGTDVSIPLIIKRSRSSGEPEMAPTDVFYVDGHYVPLTTSSIKSAVQSREFAEDIGSKKKQTGGDPYIGEMTGDVSPLEDTNLPVGATRGQNKVSADLSKLPVEAKSAIMGAIAFGGHNAVRGLENKSREAAKSGKKLTAADKARAILRGAGSGAAIGAGTGALSAAAAKSMGLETPFARRAKVASWDDLCFGCDIDDETFEKNAGYGAGHVSAAAESLLAAIRSNPYAQAALVTGAASGAMGAVQGAANAEKGELLKNTLRGAAVGSAAGAAAGAVGMAMRRKIAEVDAVIEHGLCSKLANVHPNDLANFRRVMASNPQVLQGASTNLRLIETMLKHKGPGVAAPGVKVTNPNVMVVSKDPLTDRILIKFSGGPSEAIQKEDLKSILRDQFSACIAAIDNGKYFVSSQNINEATWNVSRNERALKPANQNGRYVIRDKAGNKIYGNVIMNMVHPSGKVLALRLFLTEDGKYAVGEDLFGDRLSSNTRVPTNDKPAQGEMGVFISYVNGSAVSTTILKLLSVMRISGKDIESGEDFVAFNVMDPITGDKFSLSKSPFVNGFVKVKDLGKKQLAVTDGEAIMIPSDTEWVPVRGKVDVPTAYGDVVKISEVDVKRGRTKIVYDCGQFNVSQGHEHWRNLEGIELAELMTGMGMESSELNDVEKMAKETKDGIEIIGLNAPDLVGYSQEEIADEVFGVSEEVIAKLKPSDDLIKAAAYSGDSETLDLILGLNFINNKNIRMFTDSIDQFDEVSSKLASLLVASRLGLKHVNEDVIKEAMDGLAATGEQLKLLRSAQVSARQNMQAKTGS